MADKNKWFGLALAFALAFSALLPFFAVYTPSPSHAGTTALSSAFGEKLLICTGDGFKWVKLADVQSGKEKPSPHAGDKCPLCYTARHGLAVAVAAVVLAHYDGAHHPPVSIRYYSPSYSLYPVAPQSVRAPPLSFVA